MTGPLDAAMALGAAMMLATSPVTGECEGRVMLLCHPDGSARKILVWDREAPLPEPSASKACHACTFEKKRQCKRRGS
ncbi:MAG: hypothetical protein R3E11_10595 [Sphingobium sp.]|jgi:hypothetical protein|nr:hypothetical protein [Sphingobium sp.]MCP5399653.1 hypothetical protein [Sphingomonas sp.]